MMTLVSVAPAEPAPQRTPLEAGRRAAHSEASVSWLLPGRAPGPVVQLEASAVEQLELETGFSGSVAGPKGVSLDVVNHQVAITLHDHDVGGIANGT